MLTSSTRKLANIIFPIKNNELYKFIPMCILTFLILLNVNIIRGARDTLVVTQIGSEILSFIKLWIEMPIGILFIVFYNKISNYISAEKLFRWITAFFLLFFTLFAFIILPNIQYFHLSNHESENIISNIIHFKWFIVMLGKWSYVLYYAIAEMWAIVVYSLMYWQLANKITKPSEAPRFYILFSFFGQINLLFSASIIKYLSQSNNIIAQFFRFSNCIEIETSIKSITTAFVFIGLLIITTHIFLEKVILKRETINLETKNKVKLGNLASLKIILKSQHLGYIFILLIGYSSTINLIEGLFMSKMKQNFCSASEFLSFQGSIIFYTGIVTLIFTLSGISLLKKKGWFFCAFLTPFIITITGTLFFIAVLFQQYNYCNIQTVVIVGALYSVLSKGVKYSLFDATKEMCYLNLNDELKIKGKAAVDILGAKVGKSLGAVMQMLTFSLLPHNTHDNIVIFLFSGFLLFCFLWLFSVWQLNFLIKKK